MRNTRTLTLPDGRDLQILEARVCDVRRLLALLPAEGQGIDVIAHVQQHLGAFLHVLGDGVVLPDGVSLEHLSLSEMEALLSAWWDLHRGFFERAGTALGVVLAAPETEPEKPCENSTRP